MSERYSKLLSLPENLYTTGAPVVIAAGALLKDNQSGNVLAQLKLQNINSQTIKAATVQIFPMDTAGDAIDESITYQYLDLNAGRDTFFGQKAAIPLPNAVTRSFSVVVTEVIFLDNTKWIADGKEWRPLKKPASIGWGDPELVKQFHCDYGEHSNNMLLEDDDLWICVCGSINRSGETCCHRCRQTLDSLRAFNIENLRKRKDERLVLEKVAAEKERLEEEEAERRNIRTVKKVVAILAVVAVLCGVARFAIGAIKKNSAYNDAVALIEQGKYEEAIEAFTALDGYKDSAAQIQSAKNSIADMERAAEYDRAIQLLETGKSEKENEAYYLLMELGDYEDAKNLLEHFTYACIASDDVRYEYDLSGNLVEKDYGSSSYLYEYENGHVVWEGQSKDNWTTKTYTYYPNGILRSETGGVSRTQSGVVTNETINYNEKGWPETVIYTKGDKPDAHKIWHFTYTFSDDLITELLCSFQDNGETETTTQSVDFTEYGGFLSDIQFDFDARVHLSITNANKTRTEGYVLGFTSYTGFYMLENSETSFVYDSNGKIISKTTRYPQSKREITEHYSYDDEGNLIEERSDANENTDNRLYLTTYTYGYIYTPDVQ